eukprot:g67112.t1
MLALDKACSFTPTSDASWRTHCKHKLGGTDMGAKRPVRCIETGEVFPSVRAAARANNTFHQGILQAIVIPCKCKGFTWQYADEDPVPSA